MRKDVHLGLHIGWSVIRYGSGRISVTSFETKREALVVRAMWKMAGSYYAVSVT